MNLEVHIDWQGETRLAGRLHAAERGSSVSFEYDAGWLQREDAFAIDPTALPLQRGAHHGATLFGAIHDCGPDRWGRVLIERAVRKKVLTHVIINRTDYGLDIPRHYSGDNHHSSYSHALSHADCSQTTSGLWYDAAGRFYCHINLVGLRFSGRLFFSGFLGVIKRR